MKWKIIQMKVERNAAFAERVIPFTPQSADQFQIPQQPHYKYFITQSEEPGFS